MNPPTVELTLNSVALSRQCRERNLYVVLAITNAETPGSLTVTHLPGAGSLTPGNHLTQYGFAPLNNADGGLRLFSLPMPASKTIYARMWVMASVDGRKGLRDLLAEVTWPIVNRVEKSGLFPTVGGSTPLVISGFGTAHEGLDKLGVALVLSGDRQLGFVSMDQSFGAVTLPVTRSQAMLSGEGTVRWHWVICPSDQVSREIPDVAASGGVAYSV